jgi:hypothetical protein
MNNDTPAVATTNSYVAVWKRQLGSTSSLIMRIQETGETNDILYKIVASNVVDGTDDPDTSVELKAEATIAAGTEAAPQYLSNPWVEVAVYAKSAAPDTPGEITVTVGGK